MRFLYLIPACAPLYWKLGSAFSPLRRIFIDSSLPAWACGLVGEVVGIVARAALAVAFSSFCVGVLGDFGIRTPVIWDWGRGFCERCWLGLG